MDLKSLFYTIFRSLNPYNHEELSQNRFSLVLRYYFFIIIFSVIVMALLFIPAIYSARDYVQQGVSHFDEFNMSSDFTLNNSFNILSDPLIRFDNFKSNNSKELVVITPDSVYYKKYLMFGRYETVPLIRQVDVTASERAQRLLTLGFFFLLPALLFWAIVVSIIYFSMMIILTYLLVLLIARLLHIETSILSLLKMSIYASTPFILIQLLLMPFFRLFLLPLIIYWVLVIVILFVWQDNAYGHKRTDGENGEAPFTKKKHIFEDSDDSHEVHGPKHGKDYAKDHYDVDENGNLKGTGKKHKTFESENDSYVELK